MFQLEASETLSAGLRRLLLQQIDLARDKVATSRDPRHVRVHEARKAFKRSRAMLRLVRKELDAQTYAGLNRTFRDAARRLAALRSNWVLRELAGRLGSESEDRVAVEAFAVLRDSLEGGGPDEMVDLDDEGRLTAALSAARDRLDRWPIVRDDFELVRPGLSRVYRTGRKRMNAARREPSGERLHEWRKVVKYLWHQVEVLAPTKPTVLEPFAETIHALANLLGDEHDLCDVLRAARRAGVLAGEVELRAVEQQVGEERSRIRRAIWPIAEQVYREKPGEFAARLAAYWDEWRVEAAPQGAAGYGV
jgi:CHAD domain-containing protein